MTEIREILIFRRVFKVQRNSKKKIVQQILRDYCKRRFLSNFQDHDRSSRANNFLMSLEIFKYETKKYNVKSFLKVRTDFLRENITVQIINNFSSLLVYAPHFFYLSTLI